MMSKLHWILKQFFEKLWVIALTYAILGIATAFLAKAIGPLLPDGIGERLGSDAVETVLTILATSMLSVVTFSLGIMVSAFAGAAAAVTPRATALLKTDPTTQRVLSTFLGSFLFSLIGIIALKAGVFTQNDRLVLFAATILVVLIVVIAILRWIAHLMVFGLMSDSIRKVERAAQIALDLRRKDPFLGGHRQNGPPPGNARPVMQEKVGYICHIDMKQLQAVADAAKVKIFIAAMPGAFVHPAAPIVWIQGPEAELTGEVRGAFEIDDIRTFDQDPRFGLSVLTEIAERALSPSVNDPGTAIDVLSRAVRLLSSWADSSSAELAFPLIWVPPLEVSEMMEDIFPAIARDGAAVFSVQIRLQKSLLALAQISPDLFGKAAAEQSQRALDTCLQKLSAVEMLRLKEVAQEIAVISGNADPVLTAGAPAV